MTPLSDEERTIRCQPRDAAFDSITMGTTRRPVIRSPSCTQPRTRGTETIGRFHPVGPRSASTSGAGMRRWCPIGRFRSRRKRWGFIHTERRTAVEEYSLYSDKNRRRILYRIYIMVSGYIKTWRGSEMETAAANNIISLRYGRLASGSSSIMDGEVPRRRRRSFPSHPRWLRRDKTLSFQVVNRIDGVLCRRVRPQFNNVQYIVHIRHVQTPQTTRCNGCMLTDIRGSSCRSIQAGVVERTAARVLINSIRIAIIRFRAIPLRRSDADGASVRCCGRWDNGIIVTVSAIVLFPFAQLAWR